MEQKLNSVKSQVSVCLGLIELMPKSSSTILLVTIKLLFATIISLQKTVIMHAQQAISHAELKQYPLYRY